MEHEGQSGAKHPSTTNSGQRGVLSMAKAWSASVSPISMVTNSANDIARIACELQCGTTYLKPKMNTAWNSPASSPATAPIRVTLLAPVS